MTALAFALLLLSGTLTGVLGAFLFTRVGVVGDLRRRLNEVETDLTGLVERFSRDMKRRAAVTSVEKRTAKDLREDAERMLAYQPGRRNDQRPVYSPPSFK